MMDRFHTRIMVGLVATVLFVLASCGGGGSGGTTTQAQPPSFPLQSGWIAAIKSGSQIGYKVSGNCIGYGSASSTTSTPIPAIFEGVSGVSVANRLAMSLVQCGPTSYASSISTDYYDTNYVQLGTIVTGGDYSVFTTPPNTPALVKVGDTGAIGTKFHYTDSTKTVLNGQDVITYVIEPDTANTAIVNVISTFYNSSGILTSTEQDRYRIATDGTLNPVSSDIQYASSNAQHFVLTVIPNPPMFMALAYVPTGSQPSAVAIGDVNGDGKNDVIMTTYTSIGDVVNDRGFKYEVQGLS